MTNYFAIPQFYHNQSPILFAIDNLSYITNILLLRAKHLFIYTFISTRKLFISKQFYEC